MRMRPLFLNEQEKQDFLMRHEKAVAKRGKLSEAQGETFLGMDIGSTTVKAVLTDPEGRILYSYYGKNEGSPIECGIRILKDIYDQMPEGAYIQNACATGYGEALMMAALRIPELEEVHAERLAPLGRLAEGQALLPPRRGDIGERAMLAKRRLRVLVHRQALEHEEFGKPDLARRPGRPAGIRMLLFHGFLLRSYSIARPTLPSHFEGLSRRFPSALPSR